MSDSLAPSPFAALAASAAASAPPAADPAGNAQAADAVPAGAVAAPATVALPATSAATLVAIATVGPRYVGGAVREEVIPLLWPIEFSGKTYTAIVLKRPSAGVVGAYFEHLVALPQTGATYMPIFYHEDGEPVPSEVMDFLDADDDDAVMKATTDFLPARLRRLLEAQPVTSRLQDGDATAARS